LKKKRNLSSIELKKYFKAPDVAKQKFSKDKIAIIYASGEIGMGEGDNDNIGSEAFLVPFAKLAAIAPSKLLFSVSTHQVAAPWPQRLYGARLI